MNANELRLGNIIQAINPLTGDSENVVVYNILPTALLVLDNKQKQFAIDIHKVVGIPLSPAEMHNAKFSVSGSLHSFSTNGSNVLRIDFDVPYIKLNGLELPLVPAYLHQLQNLFYALFQTELKYEPEITKLK